MLSLTYFLFDRLLYYCGCIRVNTSVSTWYSLHSWGSICDRDGNLYVGSEVLTSVGIESSISWDIISCSPLKVNGRFGGVTWELTLFHVTFKLLLWPTQPSPFSEHAFILLGLKEIIWGREDNRWNLQELQPHSLPWGYRYMVRSVQIPCIIKIWAVIWKYLSYNYVEGMPARRDRKSEVSRKTVNCNYMWYNRRDADVIFPI
jgi:hypothetical protein